MRYRSAPDAELHDRLDESRPRRSRDVDASLALDHTSLWHGYGTRTGVTSNPDDVEVLGRVPLSTVNGVATARLATRSLGVGNDDIEVFYWGDSADLGGDADDIAQLVAADTTTVDVVAVDASASATRCG